MQKPTAKDYADRVLVTQSYTLDISINYLPLELWEPSRRGGGKSEKPEGMEDTRRKRPPEFTKQGSNELKETGAASIGLHWSASDPWHICYNFQLSIFMDS